MHQLTPELVWFSSICVVGDVFTELYHGIDHHHQSHHHLGDYDFAIFSKHRCQANPSFPTRQWVVV